MRRSRPFLAACALVASLAWTNVQAMSCCWMPLGNAEAPRTSETATSASAAKTSHSADASSSEQADAEHIGHPACHAPAATSQPDDAHHHARSAHHDAAQDARAEDAHAGNTRPQDPRAEDAHAQQATAPSSSGKPHGGDDFGSCGTARLAACCEPSAPAEAFSPVPPIDAPRVASFFALPASPALGSEAASGPPRAQGPPPYYVLGRFLI